MVSVTPKVRLKSESLSSSVTSCSKVALDHNRHLIVIPTQTTSRSPDTRKQLEATKPQRFYRNTIERWNSLFELFLFPRSPSMSYMYAPRELLPAHLGHLTCSSEVPHVIPLNYKTRIQPKSRIRRDLHTVCTCRKRVRNLSLVVGICLPCRRGEPSFHERLVDHGSDRGDVFIIRIRV